MNHSAQKPKPKPWETITPLQQKIMHRTRHCNFSPDEQLVFELIALASFQNEKISQRGIANSAKWLGCHPRFEKDLYTKPKSFESTLRQVRQIIRDLRVNHKIVILSDSKGFWIPKGVEEIKMDIERRKRQAESAAHSYRETVECMKEGLELISEKPEFLQQKELFVLSS